MEKGNSKRPYRETPIIQHRKADVHHAFHQIACPLFTAGLANALQVGLEVSGCLLSTLVAPACQRSFPLDGIEVSQNDVTAGRLHQIEGLPQLYIEPWVRWR